MKFLSYVYKERYMSLRRGVWDLMGYEYMTYAGQEQQECVLLVLNYLGVVGK
jgi:hypothetical protein